MSLPVPPDVQRGLIYTVHPRILAPLIRGNEYRILASTRIRLQHAHLPSYEPLYRRARLIARRRAEELTCQDASGHPHTRTARALQRARSYIDLTEPGVDMTLVHEEWACLETGKTARPLLAHVTLSFDPHDT